MELQATLLMLIALSAHAVAVAGDLERTLKHCCRQGGKEERCTNISTPMRDVASEHLGMCLTAMEICCVEAERAKQCSLGQTDARDGQDCVSLPGIAGGYRKDCCSACKLGLIMASMTMSCASHETLFGSPWNTAYMSCCLGSTYGAREPVFTAPTRRPVLGISSDHNDVDNGDDDDDDDDICEQFKGQLCSDICIPLGKTFKCACKEGFMLDVDEKTCTILPVNNRCRMNNPCSQRCMDTGNSIECSCNAGYRLAPDKKTCNDINECASSNACQLAGMTCRNEPGYFVCVTPDGAVMQPGMLQSNAGIDSEEDEEETNIYGSNEPRVESTPSTSKCPPGYILNQTTLLCDDIDECIINSKICGKNFTCENTIGSYFCASLPDVTCNPGFLFSYEANQCEDIDECREELDTCRDKNEKCLNTMGSYICHVASKQCPAGFKYDSTERKCLDVDECAEKIHSCLDSEECLNTIGAYECVSPDGQKNQDDCGEGLEFNATIGFCVDIDECALGLDTCNRETQLCLNIHGGFNCSSKWARRRPPLISTGWTPATRSTTLRPTTAAPTPTCQPGFKQDPNTNRCIDVDECAESNLPVCDSVQQCINSVGSYRCICKRGYMEDPETLACVDVNECQLDQHDCTVGQRCDNTLGSYKCFRLTSCGTGYTLNANTGVCEDDNECLLKTDNCAKMGPKFQCKNTAGSFRCVLRQCEGSKIINNQGVCVDHNCPAGYEAGAYGKCNELNECLSNPCRDNEKCFNTPGSFTCARRLDCGRGFEMNNEGTRCMDIDECVKGTHQCSTNQQCQNTQGSHSCTCHNGYKLNHNKQCVDIDECNSYRSNYQLCSSHSTCQNVPGSYRCNCKEGFKHQNDDKVCHDIDECSVGPGLCQHNCLNTWGSFRCSCYPGFSLQADGRSCHDVDECTEFKDRNLCIGMCQNTPGSYKCRCPEGYKLGADERTCIDIDECSTNTGICRADQVCLNTRGSYQCNTIYCPPEYSRETDHKNRCKKNNLYCREGDLECMRKPQTISNNYITFVSNMAIPHIGYLDLFTMRGPMWQSTNVRFNLELQNARAPAHVTKVTKDYFRVRKQSHNQAIISMVQSIKGPQQIELHLNMDILHNGVFSSTVLAKLFLIVSEHEY